MSESVKEVSEYKQNLPLIRHISAVRTGQIDDVLSTIRSCEKIVVTDDQINMGIDIARSINEHMNLGIFALCYLIRYGMLLERDRERGGTS